jgi:hypothetical protein
MTTILTKQSDLLPELRYTSASDVKMRLQETIVRYRGELCYVRNVTHVVDWDLHLALTLRGLEGSIKGSEFYVHSSDKHLDIESIPMGWANSADQQGFPLFLARTTRTAQKQGLCPQSLAVWNMTYSDQGNGWPTSSWVYFEPLVDCINNKEFAISSASGPKGGVINASWALIPVSGTNEKIFTVWHNSICVGTYTPANRSFLLRRGRLTKVRKHMLQEIFLNDLNRGIRYGIIEQP